MFGQQQITRIGGQPVFLLLSEIPEQLIGGGKIDADLTIRLANTAHSIYNILLPRRPAFVAHTVIPVIGKNTILPAVFHDTVHPVCRGVQPLFYPATVAGCIQCSNDPISIRTNPVADVKWNTCG